MGHAKHREDWRLAPLIAAPADERDALDDSAVEQILESRVASDGGDPIAGIFNALVASLGFWLALGVVLYLT